jgi:hypothetical protein
VILKLDVYFGVTGNGSHSCHLMFQAYKCKQVVYSIRELFSFLVLECLQNHVVYRKARDLIAVILVIVFYSLVSNIYSEVFVLCFNS